MENNLNTQSNNENISKEPVTTQNSAVTSVNEENEVQNINSDSSATTQNENIAKPDTTTSTSTTQNAAETGTTNTDDIQSTKNSTNPSVDTTPVTQNTANIEPHAAAGDNYTNVHGLWLNADDIGKITVSEMNAGNITDIFVKTNLVSAPNYSTILGTIISKFQGSGIRIHAWITCFVDVNGNWINPANTTQRTFLYNSITDIIKNYDINGIHLDYVRYSGVGNNAAYNYPNATATITSFVSDVKQIILANKPKVALSAALMPEGSENAKYYGQDYAQLANYLDFLVPMIYKGNYNEDTTWIGTTTKYIVDNAINANGNKIPVIAGLQTYVSDNNLTPVSASSLNTDIKAAVNSGASGYVLFRYGLIDQNFLKQPTNTPSSFTISQINDAAARVKAYIETNHALPNYVTIGTTQVKIPDFLKLMVKSVLQINSKSTTPIALKDINGPNNSTGSFSTGNIYKTEYLDMAKRINAFIDSNGLAPNYVTSHLGKVSYQSVVYMYSKILNYYKVNKALPNYVSMNSAMKISVPVASGAPITSTVPTFTLDQIKSAATKVKTYIETNHKLPSNVTIGTSQVSMADFLRLMITGTLEINDKVNMPISLKTVKAPTAPSENVASGNIYLAGYIDLAKRLNAYIDANGALPNYASSTLGNMRYESLIYMYAKILNFESANNHLPNYVSVKPWSTLSSSGTSTPGTGSTITPVPAELQKYLLSTANCQVSNAQIKALAASITAGKTTTYDKAVAIFNWVRDKLSYSFYYNTKYGAVGALNARTGNCVDTAHLVIALERAAGIPARYEHVYARFSSGSWYGHVIAQVYVNGKWYYADATSSRNTFGVINNWSTATATIKGYYASLPF